MLCKVNNKTNKKLKQEGMAMRRACTYDSTYQGLSINTDHEKGYGCYHNVLDSYSNILNYMCNNHCKVFQCRFDLRYPHGYSFGYSKDHISVFFEYMKKYFHRNYCSSHNVDFKYLWSVDVKYEQSAPHYHCVVLVNGNAIRNATVIFERACHYWKLAINSNSDGLVHFCLKDYKGDNQENGLLYIRNNDDANSVLNKMAYQVSYLAKTRDKVGLPDRAHYFGSSRI